MRAFEAGDLDHAILALEAELTRRPDHAEAWRMLGQCHAENDEDKKAIACLERAIEQVREGGREEEEEEEEEEEGMLEIGIDLVLILTQSSFFLLHHHHPLLLLTIDDDGYQDPYNLPALLALGVSYVNELDSHRALQNLKAWVEHNPKYQVRRRRNWRRRGS